MRKTINSNRVWEKKVGYSRLKIVNDFFYVAGTTASDKNGVIIGKTASEQMNYICNFIKDTLEDNNISFNDITRTRIFLTNINDWEEVGKVHYQFFDNILPVTTVVEVSALTLKEMLIEVEFEGILTN